MTLEWMVSIPFSIDEVIAVLSPTVDYRVKFLERFNQVDRGNVVACETLERL